jgi:non-ribosomal peptide synthase protein (TIGR01720 family)
LIALTEQALLHLTTPWGDIPMADPSDPALNELGAGPAISLEYDNINQALDRIALKDPLKPAVTINERELSYATLRSLSDKLAGTLLGDHKIMTGDRVGVVMQRSELSICILAGILKSAAVYVPIDPGEEIARIKYMIEDSGCKMVICDEQLVYLLAWAPVPVLAATDLMKEEHRTIPFPQCEPHFEAYVLYTPGTITLPKGIPVSHGSLIAHSTWSLDTFDIRPSDGFASMSSFELDPGSADVWTSLLTGGTIHILPEYLSRTPEVLVKYLRNKQVSILKFTPSFFSVLLKEAAPELAKLLPGIRLLFLEGERIRPADLSLVWTMDDNIRIIQWRSIGIPPVTILAHELEKDRITYYQRHAVAGRPTGNESIFVLDPRQRPCPPGIIGEIYVAISHHPERAGLLKTGDKGYWNLYHELELAGNEDRLDAFQEDGMEGLADDLPAGVRAEMMEMVRTIWEEVFRRKNIGGHDNFFHLGGDSIKALQISSRLHAKGYLIHAMEIFNHPSIAALASAIKPNARHTGMASFEGAFPMTPVYQYFFEHTKIAPHHYNQSMLLSVANTEMEELDEIIGKIFENHDILRLTMQRNEEDWAAFVQPVGFRAALACTAIDADQDGLQHLQDIAAPLQTGFDLLTGPLAHFHLFTTKRGNYLFIVLHHLVTDVVSWNILVDDINELLDLRQKGLPLLLPFRAGSYGLWASRLAEYALSPRIQGQFDHWSATPSGMTLPIDNPQGSNRFRYISTCSFMLDKEDTAKLIDSNNVNGQQGIQACILTALGMGLQTVTGLSEVLVMMESHGRQVIGEDLNIDRTMGWFTALYPLYFSFKTPEIAANRELLSGLLKEIPDNGIGYGLLRYLDHTKKDRLQHRPPIIFNYLGNNQGGGRNRLVKIVDRQFGTPESEDEYRTFEWDVISYIANGEFRLNLSYSSERFDKEKMLALTTSIRNALLEIVNQKTKPAALAYDELTREDIESFFD